MLDFKEILINCSIFLTKFSFKLIVYAGILCFQFHYNIKFVILDVFCFISFIKKRACRIALKYALSIAQKGAEIIFRSVELNKVD